MKPRYRKTRHVITVEWNRGGCRDRLPIRVNFCKSGTAYRALTQKEALELAVKLMDFAEATPEQVFLAQLAKTAN